MVDCGRQGVQSNQGRIDIFYEFDQCEEKCEDEADNGEDMESVVKEDEKQGKIGQNVALKSEFDKSKNEC